MSLLGALALVVAPSAGGMALAAPNTSTASITSVVIAGTEAAPVITVNGTGFTATPPTPHPSVAPCGDTSGTDGLDYASRFYLKDKSGGWGAGQTTKAGQDCIGLVITSWSTTQIGFTLGSYYSANGFTLATGDTYVVVVEGAYKGGKVPTYPPASGS